MMMYLYLISLLILCLLVFSVCNEFMWYMFLQTLVFSVLLTIWSPMLSKYYDIFKIVSKNQWYVLAISIPIVLILNIVKLLYFSQKETFTGDKKENKIMKDIDSDTEPQRSYEHNEIDNDCGSIIEDDLNILTQETSLNQIDLALQKTHTKINSLVKYLNTNQPDERWLSKKQMDDPTQRLFV